MARFTARDYLGALAHGARLLVRHRGDLTQVQAQLDREKAWARFQARHGIEVDEATMATEDPPDTAIIERLLVGPAGEGIFTADQMRALGQQLPPPTTPITTIRLNPATDQDLIAWLRRTIKGTGGGQPPEDTEPA